MKIFYMYINWIILIFIPYSLEEDYIDEVIEVSFNLTSSTTSIVPNNHRLVCTSHETQQKACLNSGTCLASNIGGNRIISCKCPFKYTGSRCHYIDPRIIFWLESKNERQKVELSAGLICLLMLLITAAMVVTCFVCKRRAKKKGVTILDIDKLEECKETFV